MSGRIRLARHDPAWAQLFAAEAGKLAVVFADQAIAIHHIGSTCIPGVPAKPIIDVLIEVHDIETIDDLNEQMRSLGYEPRGELGIAGRRYFRKRSDGEHTHHVHVFQTGHAEVERHLSFRDYLIAHPEEAQAYGRLKEMLAGQFAEDRGRYTEAKSGFIEEMVSRARACKAAVNQQSMGSRDGPTHVGTSTDRSMA